MSEININDPATPESILKGKKIMWVEDDKFLNDIISRKLSGTGCELMHVGSGEEAFAKIEEAIPDIILLDILLPGMDGYEILKKLKENPKSASVPVIILSNLGQKSDVERGKELGADKFLIKATVSLDEIISEIAEVLEAKK